VGCVVTGVEAALRPRPSRQLPLRKLDGAQEAHLVALACSKPPTVGARWSIRLLADELVELEIVDAISYGTVRRTLKNEIKPWLKQQYCLPGEPSGEFVFPMEDVLEVYTRPYDPYRPHVCLDETSVQLVGETCIPLPTRPGQSARLRLRVRAPQGERRVHVQRAAAWLAGSGRG
jgi:Homeodomain-like domain